MMIRKKPLKIVDPNVELKMVSKEKNQEKQEPMKKRRFSFYADAAESQKLDRSTSREHELTEELAKLQSKYEKLKELKFADVEGIYAKYKTSVKERNAASDDLLGWYKDEADRLRTLTQKSKEVNACKELENYRRENAALKGELLDIKAQLVEFEMKALDVNSEAQTPVKMAEPVPVSEQAMPANKSTNLLRIFEILTGGIAKEIGENAFDVMIINTPKDRHMRFKVVVSGTDIEYEPLEIALGEKENATIAKIPDYLRENIYFEIAEAPIFFSKINAAVFSR